MAAEPTNLAARPDLMRALRAACFTALIAAGLFLPLIAFRATHDIRNELVLETRWPLFAVFVASAFATRLIWELLPRQRIAQALARFVRSPGQLAVAAAAFAMTTILLRIVAHTSFGVQTATAILL